MDNLTENKNDIRINFEFADTLTKPHNSISNKQGVYLFVYDREKIIYVGQSKSILERIIDHRRKMEKGGRTIWNINENDKLYDLMSANKSEEITTELLFRYYNKLYHDEKVWLPGFVKEGKYWLAYYDNKPFKESFLSDNYLNKINILVINEDDIDRRKMIESLFQAGLRKKHNICYYEVHWQRSWLGKQEKSDDDLKKYFYMKEFNFNYESRIDENLRNVLEDLNKAVKEFLKKD